MLLTLEELLSAHSQMLRHGPSETAGGSFHLQSMSPVAPAEDYTQYHGTSRNDSIDGSIGSDMIFGYQGDDTLYGAGGADSIHGDIGNDILDGGQGRDDLRGNEGRDRLYGGLDDDDLTGGEDGDYIDGGEGIDTVNYSDCWEGININLRTGLASGGHATGDILQSVENVMGGRSEDVLYGSAGDNTILGYTGSDMVVGEGGTDLLYGGVGDDMLIVNEGGFAYMWGGSGDDRFVIFPECQAKIQDFAPGTDGIDELLIYKNVFANAAEALAAVTQVGHSVFITKGNFKVELVGVQWWQLHANDFTFLDI